VTCVQRGAVVRAESGVRACQAGGCRLPRAAATRGCQSGARRDGPGASELRGAAFGEQRQPGRV